jgi:hypothetical protein
MTETIRIPNIENYIQEIVNGELVLTPKTVVKKTSFEKYIDKVINQCNIEGKCFILKKLERNLRDDYNYNCKQCEIYESEILETLDTDGKREWLKKLLSILYKKKEENGKLRISLFGHL